MTDPHCRRPIPRLAHTFEDDTVATPNCLLPAGHEGDCDERNPDVDYEAAYKALEARS